MCSAYEFIVGAIGTRGLPEIQIVCPFGKLQNIKNLIPHRRCSAKL